MENVEEKNKNKSFKFIMTIILIIIGIGLCGGSFYLGTKYSNNEQQETNQDNNNESKIEEENDKIEEKKELEKNEKYTFIEEKKENIKINGDNVEMVIYYYIDNQELTISSPSTFDSYKSNDYIVRKDIFINGVNEIGTIPIRREKTLEQAKESIKKDNNDDYKFIKDKKNENQYIALYTNQYHLKENGNEIIGEDTYGDGDIYLYILDKNGKKLKKYEVVSSDGAGIVVDTIIPDRDIECIENTYNESGDKTYILFYENRTELHEDYFYYIIPYLKGVEEYIITIENGILKEELNQTYPSDSYWCVGSCASMQ